MKAVGCNNRTRVLNHILYVTIMLCLGNLFSSVHIGCRLGCLMAIWIRNADSMVDLLNCDVLR